MSQAVMNIKIGHTVFTWGAAMRILWQKIIKSEKQDDDKKEKIAENSDQNKIFRLRDKWQLCDNMQYAVAR
jgi:hypothetical protein